ncbi:hypothetical protein, partial [Porcipelethomonas sp.]|uniref:hypothetical protein n=1 Tax=Porcipelethomonas sp. TaxID=2981675 RepID=UPI003EF9DAFA
LFMAGVIVHLAIADTTYKGLKIADLSQYYTGNIAPDCIHSRKNYQREMKKHTHLRDSIRDWEFILPENQRLFHERMNEFVSKYCREEENHDLYLGYLVHLITDEMFMKTIRLECAEEAEKIGILQTDKRFFEFMMREVNGADSITAHKFKFSNDPVRLLMDGQGIGIKDYIKPEEIIDSEQWIIDNFFSGHDNFESPVYLSFERIMKFIEDTSGAIYHRLDEYSLI